MTLLDLKPKRKRKLTNRGLAGALFKQMQSKAEGADYRRRSSYQPYGTAKAAFESQAPEILLSGPAGTGKSRMWLEKAHYLALTYPGARILIVRKTRASLTETGLVTLEQHVLGDDHPILLGVGGRVIGRANRQAYKYPNSSIIVVGGLDKPTKIMSSEYDFIFVQEAIELTLEDWESLTTRLRNGVVPYQQLAGDTNPDSEYHWLYRRCQEGQCKMLNATHEDNPRLYNQTDKKWTKEGVIYLSKLDNLTGVRYDRLRWGKWAQAQGAVYEDYLPAVHVIDRFEIPSDWRLIRSIDFGYRNPFVCQWWAVDHDGRMYLYREIYKSSCLVEDHAKKIVALSQGERFEATVADHDAEDRATLERHGVRTSTAKKEIKTGIEAVQKRLRKDDTGKPAIFIFRDALVERDEDLYPLPVSTEQEFPSYVYPKNAEGKAIKELPVDLNNHGMDAMRYAVMYLERSTGRGQGQAKHKLHERKRRKAA